MQRFFVGNCKLNETKQRLLFICDRKRKDSQYWQMNRQIEQKLHDIIAPVEVLQGEAKQRKAIWHKTHAQQE